METQFKNLIELQKYFNNGNVCWDYLEQLRWNGKVVCPFCKSERHNKFKSSRTYKCKDCQKKFNAKIGTIFENTKILLSKWFITIYIATSHKKGISSLQLSKDIGVTQKTAWFILHRIREMLSQKAPYMLNGTVEIDETFIGQSFTTLHRNVRRKLKRAIYNNKTMVFGILERNGNVWTKMVKGVDGKTLKPIIRNTVDKSSTIMTDGYGAYYGLDKEYHHEILNHLQDEWVRGEFHTNSIEGFWSQLKRGIYGIYHHASPKHLQRYCDEFSFRYNTRNINESDRFDYSLLSCEKRLKYSDLITN